MALTQRLATERGMAVLLWGCYRNVPGRSASWTTTSVPPNLTPAVAGRQRRTVVDTRALVSTLPQSGEMPNRPGGQMGGGEQQMLTVARSLMGNPCVLHLFITCIAFTLGTKANSLASKVAGLWDDLAYNSQKRTIVLFMSRS
jgi:predicted ABC-type transport system involved in lysophospholipase L1 biosynthesis ATPase subunit